MKILNCGLMVGLFLNLTAANCLSRTLHIPADYTTIQGAIDAASAVTSDTILVSPGIYNEAINFSGKPALLISESGPSATTIIPPTGVAAVTFNSGESSNSILSGFTITNGGIFISFGKPTIISNTIVNCGTAIDSHSGCPRIENNTILGTTGYGIYLYAVYGGTAIVSDNTIVGSGNDGIYVEAASAGSSLIQGNLIESNSASGILLHSSGAITIINNSICNNRLDGIHNDYSSPNIIQNMLLNNMGSGILNQSSFEMRGPWMVNNTVVGNGNAGIWMNAFEADDCEIYNNIVVGEPALNLFPLNPSHPYIIKFNNFYSPTGTAYLSSDTTNCNINFTNTDYISFNVSTNPFFVCLPGGDYHLLSGSSCIQSGTALAPLYPKTDFDGYIRMPLQNPSNLADKGAYGYNFATPPTPCLYLNIPSNIVMIADAGQNSKVVNYPTPDATFGSTVIFQPASGTIFPAGTNVVMCTSMYGTNILTASFTVTVFVPPSITNQPSIIGVLQGRQFTA